MARRKPQMGKPDANQTEIIKALELAGYSVLRITNAAFGAPDLLVGKDGKNWLFEVKKKGTKLNEAQVKWHANWRGNVATIRSATDAFEFIHTRL